MKFLGIILVLTASKSTFGFTRREKNLDYETNMFHRRGVYKRGFRSVVGSCAVDGERALDCKSNQGKQSCCQGLVCHDVQYWRCVKEENKSCAGPLTIAKACDSKWEDAAEKCCDGLICKDKFCDVDEPQVTLACEDGDPRECGCNNVKQADYRGNIAVTVSGKPCQRWDLQSPHKHSRTIENYPSSGLIENFCRNPDGEDGAWCYTTDPGKRWEYCNVARCGACESPNPETCGCNDVKQADYRGTINRTVSGKQCQRWDHQSPHKHSRTAQNYPNFGLDENYCRNPDGEGGAWCYTTDAGTRWEYCDVAHCGSACEGSDPRTCGCSNVKQKDYRGTINKTVSGRQCQRWDSQCPHGHSRTDQNYPSSGLDENYCRNPDGEDGAWCYTTDPKKRWEYCDVAHCSRACDDSNPETCGCSNVKQKDYRGTISKTVSGKKCQRWDSQWPHGHSRTAQNYPSSGLVENYCRNPDGEDNGAWCYTTDSGKRWEYCDVDNCGRACESSNPETCGCSNVKQNDYRGTINKTASGRQCQRWDSQWPHGHSRTVQNYPGKGLVENYCRNPDGEGGAWCYTTDSGKRWEYCDVDNCGSACDASNPQACGCSNVKQNDYRGTINKTVSGRQCQRWDSQSPHGHSRTVQNYPGKGLVENYCRNPDGEDDGAWCYTTDPGKRWEYCDVAFCGRS